MRAQYGIIICYNTKSNSGFSLGVLKRINFKYLKISRKYPTQKNVLVY